MDGDWDENEAPLKIENENDLDYQEYQEEFHTEQRDQTIKKTVKLELYNLEEVPTRISQVPEIISPHTVQDMKPEHPKEIPGVRNSSRVKFQTK